MKAERDRWNELIDSGRIKENFEICWRVPIGRIASGREIGERIITSRQLSLTPGRRRDGWWRRDSSQPQKFLCRSRSLTPLFRFPCLLVCTNQIKVTALKFHKDLIASVLGIEVFPPSILFSTDRHVNEHVLVWPISSCVKDLISFAAESYVPVAALLNIRSSTCHQEVQEISCSPSSFLEINHTYERVVLF